MITKETTIATIEVNEDDTVIVRERVSIIDDETLDEQGQPSEISHSFVHRQYAPGDDYSEADPRVQAVCQAVHGA